MFVIVLKFKNVTFFRWTGSDNNNKGNAGQGQKRTDRSNVIEIANKTFKSCYNNDSDASYIGCPARNYPKKLSESTFLGFDKYTLAQLAFSGSKYSTFISKAIFPLCEMGKKEESETVTRGGL